MYNFKDDMRVLYSKRGSDIKKESIINMLLGFWITIVPILIGEGFKSNSVNIISWNLTLTGLSIFILSYMTLRYLVSWGIWLIFGAGAWLMLSPWLLSYVSNTSLFLNSLVPGLIIMLSAGRLIPRSEQNERTFYHRYFKRDFHH